MMRLMYFICSSQDKHIDSSQTIDCFLSVSNTFLRWLRCNSSVKLYIKMLSKETNTNLLIKGSGMWFIEAWKVTGALVKVKWHHSEFGMPLVSLNGVFSTLLSCILIWWYSNFDNSKKINLRWKKKQKLLQEKTKSAEVVNVRVCCFCVFKIFFKKLNLFIYFKLIFFIFLNYFDVLILNNFFK
jgi:hypothetical protein